MNLTRAGIFAAAILFIVGIFFFCFNQETPEPTPVQAIKATNERVKAIPLKEPAKPLPSYYFVKALRSIKKGEMIDRDAVEEVWFDKPLATVDEKRKIDTSALALGLRATKFIKKGKFLLKEDLIDTGEDMR